jgi:DNA-binding MarR family transcriptional regulator
VSVGGGYYIDVADVRRAQLHVAVTPLPSLSCALRDAAGANRNATPPSWCSTIRAQLSEADFRTLAPFITRQTILVPDPLLGLADPPGESLKEAVERMIETPTDALYDEIVQCRTATRNPAWIEAERDPERWLRRYIAALLRAWKGFAPIWKGARVKLETEAERIRTATMNQGQLALLDGLLDLIAADGDRLWFECDVYAGRMQLPYFGLVLMPMIGGRRAKIVAQRDQTLTALAYPIANRLATVDGDDGSALDALLGGPRAELLRSLTRAETIGAVAEQLQTVPSAASYHVDALEAAGLVRRDRRGRHVLVSRTERGEDLLALYSALRVQRDRRSA